MIKLPDKDESKLHELKLKYAPRYKDGTAIYPHQNCEDVWFLYKVITRLQKGLDRAVEQRDFLAENLAYLTGRIEYDVTKENDELNKILEGE